LEAADIAMTRRLELKASELRSICDPKVFKFKNTSQIKPLDEVIGQQRAVQAIEFGLNMKDPGYNLFITGIPGTGKSTIVKDLVNKHAKKQASPNEWCLVNNFRDEYRPHAIAISPGKAVSFRKRMNKVVDDLKKDLPKALESESYLKKLSKMKNRYAEEKSVRFHQLEEFAAEMGFKIERLDTDFQIVPVVDGEPIPPEEYLDLQEDLRARIEENMRTVQTEVDAKAREIDKMDQSLRVDIEKLLDEVALSVVRAHLGPIRDAFKNNEDIQSYIDSVQTDVIENFNIFIPSDKSENQPENPWVQSQKIDFQRYQVNVLVEQASAKGAPVVFESNPTYYNVFGRIEKRAYLGTVSTDFTMVQAGSLLNANGGYLIMEIDAVLMNPFVWEALKRALRTKSLQIEDIAEESGFGTTALKPQPIPLDIKVILLGSYEEFEYLQNEDPRFNKIFKVRADFDYEVERTPETIQQYSRFIARVCKEENLLPFNPKSVAAIVEYGEKFVSDQNKLSIRFGPIHGVLKEADYWARKNNARIVSDKYVFKAFHEHRFRYNLYEEKVHESYLKKHIMIDVEGEVVGQVNALVIYQIGELSFGRPARITAETYLGKQGVINIEREAQLSGSTHDKGVLILGGYLGRTFAQHYPLSLSISITFEQSYGGVDGDSASSTELYAIISSLSGIPIKQGIAVTGSVNQKGLVQAIGGVNHKIEGFFEVCKENGLTGDQGVVIPSTNRGNLMLKKEVIDAVKQKKFHIFHVSTIEEGIEILTGVPAGKPDQHGKFPVNTVYHAVQQKLLTYFERFCQIRKEFEGYLS
jgi:lon-related putative ATP-dependent protease